MNAIMKSHTKKILQASARIGVQWDVVLKGMGYRRISRTYGVVSRIDRPDWKEHMASTHPGGMDWVNCLLQTPGQAEDHYRRCHSNDKIELGQENGLKIPSAAYGDEPGYVEVSEGMKIK